jgi:polysaccharide biosynthesis protein PslG
MGIDFAESGGTVVSVPIATPLAVRAQVGKGRWRVIAASASLACALFVGLGAPSQSVATPAVVNCGTTTVHCHPLRVGVNDDWATKHYNDADLATARDAGLGLIRFPWSWADTQPTGPNEWQWGLTDRIMAAAKDAGEQVIFKPEGSPCWAHPSVPCSTPGPVPPDPAYLPEWGEYVREVVARYSDTIAAVEVWNEENVVPYWSATISPVRFVGLLKAAYTATKSVDPQMKVVYGGLSPSTSTSPTQMDYRQFLQATLAHGAGDYFDALAIHPYVLGAGPDYLTRIRDLIDSVARIARDYGKPWVPIWVTEFGYASGHTLAGSGPVLSEGVQAARIYATLDLLAHMPRVPVAIVHRMFDRTGFAPHYGLLDPSGDPKPAYRAVTSWTGTAGS